MGDTTQYTLAANADPSASSTAMIFGSPGTDYSFNLNVKARHYEESEFASVNVQFEVTLTDDCNVISVGSPTQADVTQCLWMPTT